MGGMESRRKFPPPPKHAMQVIVADPVISDFVTTPPLPSSSPAPVVEHMELSPLPHKTPFCAQIEMGSPTPGSTFSDYQDMVLDSPAPIARQTSSELTKSFLAE
jgi:M-phase inducer tyrosine phosphatase